MIKLTIIFLALVLSGCATAPLNKAVTTTELKYKNILVLPIVEGTLEFRQTAFDSFYNNLKSAEDIKIVPQENLNNQYLTDIGLENPGQYSVIDFSVNEKGLDHRRKIKETLSADAIILTSFVFEKKLLAMYVQVIDVNDGELTLSFSKVLDVAITFDGALSALTKMCADKTIAHLRDNVIITTIHKY